MIKKLIFLYINATVVVFAGIFGADKFDLYYETVSGNCNSKFESKPSFMLEINFKKDKVEEIYVVTTIYENGEKSIRKLSSCKILNEKNWDCGGEFWGAGNRHEKMTMIDGNLKIESGRLEGIVKTCNPLIKRK